MAYGGRWHGEKCRYGFHYDLHVGENDRDIGKRCDVDRLAGLFKQAKADFVQADCKGHPGYTSWFSKTPAASVGPGVVKDALKVWRAATRKLGLPLHCHYSGIYDKAASAKHPDWAAKSHDGKPIDRMCPRGPYLDELMIPQMLELIDNYNVDGFWIDGEFRVLGPCYCDRCRKAFTQRTGLEVPPTDSSDPNWVAWLNFTRESFEEYVTRYCDAVHRHKPGTLVCSNWLQTCRHPGEPKVPTDWISGDNPSLPGWGLDATRCEARFISTRGKPWDLMLWCFNFSHGYAENPDWTPVMKPVQMLQQEAATIVAFGGNVQTCENPFNGVRDGRLAQWRMKRLGELVRFVKSRRTLCQGTESIPQVAILNSEHHVRNTPGDSIPEADISSMQGAVFSLLECHYGVDVLDEWALLPRLGDFPVVVVPEQDRMSDAMADALAGYVSSGGRLLVSGAKSFGRFGADFLGVGEGKLVAKAVYHVPALDGAVPVFSDPWRLLGAGSAKSLAPVGRTLLRDEELLPHPAATLNRVGKGSVAYIPCDVFREFTRSRYPLTREFVRDVMRALYGKPDIKVDAHACVDVVLRRKGAMDIVHLINRNPGLPTPPSSGGVEEIPPVGPITISMKMDRKPRKVELAFEKGKLTWKYGAGWLKVEIPSVHIHAAAVVVN